jgi:TorA maturation chaperone TorD
MCAGSASLNKGQSPSGTVPYKERLLKYKELAAAFSYPKEEELRLEYDRLFRLSEIWLYGAEYTAENEFQRAKELADISGFYRAFGLQVDKERPDALSCELEFMHYLIYKEAYCFKKNLSQAQAKAKICQDAQKKFFQAHLYPAAKKIVEKVILASEEGFYSERAQSLSAFLESEEEFFRLD